MAATRAYVMDWDGIDDELDQLPHGWTFAQAKEEFDWDGNLHDAIIKVDLRKGQTVEVLPPLPLNLDVINPVLLAALELQEKQDRLADALHDQARADWFDLLEAA